MVALALIDKKTNKRDDNLANDFKVDYFLKNMGIKKSPGIRPIKK